MMIYIMVNTTLVKDYEGLSQTTSLKVYTRDNSEMRHRISNTRGREMTQMEDFKQGPILCSLSNHSSYRMASIKEESIHYSPNNQNGSLRLQIQMLK